MITSQTNKQTNKQTEKQTNNKKKKINNRNRVCYKQTYGSK